MDIAPILLFNEADAVLGKRMAVKDSVDINTLKELCDSEKLLKAAPERKKIGFV